MSDLNQNPALSVVIPCYNERHRLPVTLSLLNDHLDSIHRSYEVIVVDDGSDDRTAEWAREHATQNERLRVVSYEPNRGKGYAVKTGMLEARGQFVLFMDADGSTPMTEIDKVLPLLESGEKDIVVGSRALKTSEVLVSQNLFRRYGGKAFVMVARVLVVSGIVDTQCGFKAFSRKAAQTIFRELEVESAIFDIELFLIAAKHALVVAEIPIVWRHNHDTRIPFHLIDSVSILIELLKIKWRHKIFWPRTVRTRPHRQASKSNDIGTNTGKLAQILIWTLLVAAAANFTTQAFPRSTLRKALEFRRTGEQSGFLYLCTHFDKVISQVAGNGNLYLKFEGFDRWNQEGINMVGFLYSRTVHQVYPRKVLVCDGNRTVQVNEDDSMEFNPTPEWLAEHDVDRVVTFTKHGDGSIAFGVENLREY